MELTTEMKEMFKQFLKENLKVEVEYISSECSGRSIEVKTILDNEVINYSYTDIQD